MEATQIMNGNVQITIKGVTNDDSRMDLLRISSLWVAINNNDIGLSKSMARGKVNK